MNLWRLATIGVLSLVSFGCATAPAPDAKSPANVNGEWLGNASVGPTFLCCKGMPGPVRMALEQTGNVAKGTLVGVGYRGRVLLTVTEKEIWGTCLCTTRQIETSLSIDGSIAGDDMVFRVGDARMTLTHTP